MGTFNDPNFPEILDAAIVVLIYHDTHLKYLNIDSVSMNQSIYDALKPGGTYLVIDHSAEPGSGLRDVESLHRIDQEIVLKEVESVGFRLVDESDILKNSDDNLDTMVMLPNVKGKSDRFIYKFIKPE